MSKSVFTVVAQHYTSWEVEKRDSKGFALDTVVHDSHHKSTLVVATRFQLKAAQNAAKQYHDKHRVKGTDPDDPDEVYFDGDDGPIAGIHIWKAEAGGKPGKGKLVETPYDYYH